MVSAETMYSSISTIHGPICTRPCGDERGEPGLRVGPHLEVVVEHRGLAVEQEPRVRVVVLEELEQVVEQVHELRAVGLERGVPLPVPVGVGDDAHIDRSAPHPVQATAEARFPQPTWRLRPCGGVATSSDSRHLSVAVRSHNRAGLEIALSYGAMNQS